MSRSLYSQLTQPTPPSRRRRLPLLLAAVLIGVTLVVIPVLSRVPAEGADPPPAAAVTPVATPTPTPTPTPFDFTSPVPQSETVDMDYFSDALFIGDSRTQGLELYSGVKGATFYDYTGLTVFGVNNPGLVTVDGQDCSIMEGLEKGPQFGKIYIAFGMNELGYYNEENYLSTFGVFLEEIKSLQPDAVIYLQNLAPVDEDRCAEYGQPSCVNNTRVAVFNQMFARLAREHQVALLDIYGALDGDTGLPEGSTSDGIHFKRPLYETWLAYLMDHTVSPETYQAAQTHGDDTEGEREP